MSQNDTRTAGVPDDWTAALDRFHKSELFAGVSKTTRANRRGHVRAAAGWLHMPLAEVTTADLQRYLDHRAFMPATRRNYVKSYRAFFRWCHDSGTLSVDPSAELRLDLRDDEEQRVRTRARTTRERRLTGPAPTPVPEPWATWVMDYRRYKRAGGTPETTLRLRTSHLERAARALTPIAPDDVTLDDLIDWMVGETWATETRRSVRSTLRDFYRWATDTGRVTDDPAAPLPAVRSSVGVPKPVAERDYQTALLDAPPRVRLMLRLAAEIGLRRAEVAQVHTRDILDVVTGGHALVVHGKGAKERVLPLSVTLAADLKSTPAPTGWLFPSDTRTGHLTPATVGDLVGRVLPAGTTMHMLRHRFATAAYAASGDLLTVQRLLGHSDPNTTQRYVSVSDGPARDLMNQIERISDPMRVSR